MNRRGFLAASIKAGAVSLGVWMRPDLQPPMAMSPEQRLLACFYGDLTRAQRIGGICLEHCSDRAALRDFGAELHEQAALTGVIQPRDESADAPLLEWVECRVRQDFDDGDVVNINGWILSRTEARLLGLAAIS